MRKTQTKNSIGKVVLSLGLLLLGEGLFGFGLFWPVMFSLVLVSKRTYWLGFFLGVILAVMTGTALGLASLVIICGLFVFERWRGVLRDNIWLTGLAAVLLGLVSDRILGLSWGWVEGLANFGLTWFLWRLDYFAEEVHLTSR
ncbi:MAG: hypothetical protein WAV56_00085 [Microgenomates group bacterium]